MGLIKGMVKRLCVIEKRKESKLQSLVPGRRVPGTKEA